MPQMKSNLKKMPISFSCNRYGPFRSDLPRNKRPKFHFKHLEKCQMLLMLLLFSDDNRLLSRVSF